MKKTISLLILFVAPIFMVGQGIYWAPSPINPNEPSPRLYVDITSDECSCPELQDADPETNPLYFWSWEPVEDRPTVEVNGEQVDVTNGNWTDSNDNLQMKRDPFNSDLWYFDFAGVSLTEFYFAPEALFDVGVSFLIKEDNGSPDGQPEQKSIDMNIDVVFSTTSDFELEIESITAGVAEPTVITHAGDERIFGVEQPGVIRIFYRDGSVEPVPFLDIQDRVQDFGGEQGLLGLAFPPDYCTDGRFYVNYTHTDQGQLVTRISRFEVDSENPNQGDPNSEEILLQFDQDFGNHNGGHLEFGPDGYLYIGTGDGGSGGDPNNRAQNITSYLGKMLRIDVSPENGYDIPLDNPYIFDDFGQDEIWSFGLRNPWKFAFDRLNGNLYIADVGQNEFEEVNFEPVGASGGLNYGWRCYEGDADFNLSGCDAPEYIFPVLDYAHSDPEFNHCSVTGGRVYRGPSFEALYGWYFFTDFCSGYYWAIQPGSDEFEVQELGTIGASFVTTWGEDFFGEVYLGNSAQISRIIDPTDQLEEPIFQNGTTLSTSVEGTAYSWFYDGELLGVSSEPEIEIEATGPYTLEIETAAGCTVDLEIVVNALTDGVKENDESAIVLYPNPADRYFEIPREIIPDQGLELRIFSVEGREVLSKHLANHGVQIDVSQLSSGMYFVELRTLTGDRIGEGKLVVD